jgi:outer membrane protein assembly factor BamB
MFLLLVNAPLINKICRGSKLKPRMLIYILFILLFGTNTVCGYADDIEWPRWRGPNGDGISNETNWDSEALVEGPKVLWKVDIGAGYSNVAIKDNRLYTMGLEGKKSIIFCLNVDSGEEIWHYSFDNSRGGQFPQSTPTIDGKYVYALSKDGLLLCLKVKNGKVRWSKNIVVEYNIIPPVRSEFATSPVINNDLLILNANTSGLALEKKTGNVVWTSEPPIGDVGQYSTPVLYEFGEKTCVLIFGQRKGSEGSCLYSVDVETGEILWFYEVWNGDLPADPIIYKNRIFISRGYSGGSILLEMNGNEVSVLWENQNMKNHFSSCVRIDGYIYGTHGQVGPINPFRCIDLETGDIMWEKEMRTVSLISADGKLIILEENGTLRIAEATPSSYTEISSGDVLKGEKKLRKFWTPPVLYKGKIYVRNLGGDLVCIDVSK